MIRTSSGIAHARILLLSTLMLVVSFLSIQAQEVERIEPPFWWVGMEETTLQIIVYGSQMGACEVHIDYPGVSVSRVVKGDSPNYLFIYLDISYSARPGEIEIRFTNQHNSFGHLYQLKSRSNTEGVSGFNNSDVLYLIMPDRFSNGDPGNDKLDDVDTDRNNPDLRHGGDLKGIENHLTYLKDLGITTLWFNPLLENKMPGGSYHGYATTDYYNIDPRFGTNEEYQQLVTASHSRGLKVVMDVIFNHVGDHHWWMRDLPFHDWIHQPKEYVQTNHFKYTWMDNHAAPSEKDVLINGWFVPFMVDLNQENPHLATYLIQNTLWWIEFARIDGIRMDTYPYGDYAMTAEWCRRVYEEYPDFSIVGEAFYPKTAGGAWWQSNSKLNPGSDTHLKTVMDFELRYTMEHAFDAHTQTREGYESGLYKIYEVIAQDFLYPDPNNVLIFLDNHDVSRFNRADDKNLNKFKQAIAFLLTTRGIPQLYYGTELLFTGDVKDGDGLLRPDFPGGWDGDAVNAFEASGRTPRQNEAWSYLQKMLHWRQNTPAVHDGKLIHYVPSKDGVYAYARIKDAQTILVMLNGTDEDQALDMKRFYDVVQGHTRGVDIISGKEFGFEKKLELPARGVYILELK